MSPFDVLPHPQMEMDAPIRYSMKMMKDLESAPRMAILAVYSNTAN